MIGITAAMAGGTGLTDARGELPEQYYDVGIAEQDAVLFASGLAIQGAKPVCAIYSTFLQRAYDQIVHDVCLQKLNVVFAMDRAGLVGDDGPTHHGAFDVSYFRSLPNVVADGAARRGDARATCCAPRSPTTTGRSRSATRAAPPRACRCPTAPARSAIGTGEVLREGERVALLGYGYGVQVALDAAERSCRARPLGHRRRRALREAARRELIEPLAADHELLVTIEENVLPGGFGSGVLEHLEDTFAGPADGRAC